MPIYAYRCKDCGEESEHIQKFSDPPMTVCESCGGRIEKQITAAAFHLKGGGWYKDGYASSKPGGGDAKPAGDAGKGKDKVAGDSGSAKTSGDASSKKPASEGKGSGSGKGKKSA